MGRIFEVRGIFVCVWRFCIVVGVFGCFFVRFIGVGGLYVDLYRVWVSVWVVSYDLRKFDIFFIDVMVNYDERIEV